MEGYIALTLLSLTHLSKDLNWSTDLGIKQNLFAIVTIIVCAIAPIGMTFFFTKNFSQFRDKNFLLRFSSVIGEFN
jgi:hypothetical protein